MKNILINKKVIFALQFIIIIIAFFVAYTSNSEPTNNQNIEYLKHMTDFLKLPKPLCILRIFRHNYLLSLLQAVLSFFSFGIFGIWFLFNTFYTYGFTFKYTANLFLFLEMLGTIISIYFSTSLSFHTLRDGVKIQCYFRKIIAYLIINFIVFFVASCLEGNLIFG